MNKESKWYKSPIAIALFWTPLGTILFKFVLNLFSGVELWKSMLNALLFLWNSVINILTFSVPFWIIILGLLVFLIFKRFREKVTSREEVLDRKIREFSENTYDELKWTWRYEFHSTGYDITDLIAYCPKCNSTLEFHESGYAGGTYYCCVRDNDHIVKNVRRPSDIKKIIADDIRRIINEHPK